MDSYKVENVKKHMGIAGRFSVTADVSYGDEPTERIEFVGSTYGGPVVMIPPSGIQTFVTNPDRCGEFGTEWVRRFFGVGSSVKDSGSAVIGVLIFLPFLAGLAWLVGMIAGLVSSLPSVAS